MYRANEKGYKVMLLSFIDIGKDKTHISFFKMILCVVMAFVSVSLLSSCKLKLLPVERDDFSVLGKDIFSDFIRYGRYERGDATLGRSVGVSMIDTDKIAGLSRVYFLGKTKNEIIEIFQLNGGECSDVRRQVNKLRCKVRRKWKLKNVGATFDTKYWPEPAVVLLYTFTLSPDLNVTDLNVLVVDVTKPKVIIERPSNK
ncbi:hypothetical protein G9409_04470 [Chlorobium sp. BLA1]|nr:hypothetical protein [Candidatus Chlorobium masyuteum]